MNRIFFIIEFSVLIIVLICSCEIENKNSLNDSGVCYSLNGQNYIPKGGESRVSIIKVIANPEKFNYQYITTNGYFLYYGSKRGVLCLLIEDIEKGGLNCIYLYLKEEPSDILEKKYVMVSGIFIYEDIIQGQNGKIEVDIIEMLEDILIKDVSQRYIKDMRSLFKTPHLPLFR